MDNSVGRQPCLSPRQKEIIVGTLLGDGRLECRSKQGSARLRVHHGEKQKELVFWKYAELRSIVSKGPRRIKSWTSPNGDPYFSWYFHTLTLRDLGEYHRVFYRGGRKIVPEEIERLLTPLSLSVWYMDDGCYCRSNIIINTQGFDLIGQKRLQGALRRKFSIRAVLCRDRDKFRLVVSSSKSVSRFFDLVRDYAIEPLIYKVVPVSTDPKGESYSPKGDS